MRTTAADGFWIRYAVRVREVLAELCDVPESRIEMQAPIEDAARFDLALLPPRPERHQAMHQLMLNGVLKHFDLELRRETRAHASPAERAIEFLIVTPRLTS